MTDGHLTVTPARSSTVGEICDLFRGEVQTGPFGSQLHSSDYSQDGTPVVMPQDMHDGRVTTARIARVDGTHAVRLRQHALRRGDITFSRRGDVARFAVITEREEGWLCGTGSIRIRLNCPDIDVGYLRRYLNQPSVGAWLEHNAKGVTMPNLNTTIVRALPLVYPPLPEQRRIAAILDQADALRAKRREALAQLDSLTQSIFIEMFGDPAKNPKSWAETALSKLVREDDTINYGVVQPGDALDEGIPLVRVGDLVGGEFSVKTLKRIDPSIEAAYKRSRLRGDEILLSCVGSIGVTVLATPAMKGFNIARAVVRIPLAKGANRIFVASFLKTDAVQNHFTSELRTVAQPTLNIKQIAETKVFCPPLALQQTFATRIQSVESLKVTHRAALAELDALFAALQHRAFAGQLS